MIKNQIKETCSQMAVCQLDPGQTLFCEAGRSLRGLLAGRTD